MAVAKKKKSKFIVRKSKKTGQRIKLYGGPMLKVLAAEKARAAKRNSAAKVKLIVRKNGRRLYGAAANAVLRKRNSSRTATDSSVKSPTRTSTSTKAYTRGNVTVTGGAGAGATNVDLRRNRQRNAKSSKLERLVRVAGGDRLDDAYKILANPSARGAIIRAFKAATDGRERFVSATKKTVSLDPPERSSFYQVTPRGIVRLHRYSAKAGNFTVSEIDGLSNQLMRLAKNPKRNSALVIVNPKRKRNGLYEEFHGEDVRKITTDLAPDGTPNNVDILGKIDCIYFQKDGEHVSANGKTKNWLEFGKDGEARPKLASNQAGNRFYIVGNLTPFTPNGTFGPIARLEYSARKPHIEGHDKEVGYWHKLGEENGVRPTLETDHEGFLVIKGGDYRTTADGIIN